MHDDVNHAAQTGRRVALVGIAASGLLATLNIVVGIITQSTSVVATGVEFAGVSRHSLPSLSGSSSWQVA